ncbi:hypothetical protein LZ30DRAFT_277601 [Colletotrichum cereale]|nr:hypothetical protein LZ30DRAFT_277601 [Colletotrichum cereale]
MEATAAVYIFLESLLSFWDTCTAGIYSLLKGSPRRIRYLNSPVVLPVIGNNNLCDCCRIYRDNTNVPIPLNVAYSCPYRFSHSQAGVNQHMSHSHLNNTKMPYSNIE